MCAAFRRPKEKESEPPPPLVLEFSLHQQSHYKYLAVVIKGFKTKPVIHDKNKTLNELIKSNVIEGNSLYYLDNPWSKEPFNMYSFLIYCYYIYGATLDKAPAFIELMGKTENDRKNTIDSILNMDSVIGSALEIAIKNNKDIQPVAAAATTTATTSINESFTMFNKVSAFIDKYVQRQLTLLYPYIIPSSILIAGIISHYEKIAFGVTVTGFVYYNVKDSFYAWYLRNQVGIDKGIYYVQVVSNAFPFFGMYSINWRIIAFSLNFALPSLLWFFFPVAVYDDYKPGMDFKKYYVQQINLIDEYMKLTDVTPEKQEKLANIIYTKIALTMKIHYVVPKELPPGNHKEKITKIYNGN